MNKNTIRNIILVLFLYKFVLYNNVTSLLHANTSVPTSTYSLDKLSTMLEHVPELDTYTFIDFGCGTGHVLLDVHDKVKRTVGVEIDPSVTSVATNATIHIMDMRDFSFVDEPTVFFLYEPLWNVEKSNAMAIYHRVFSNLVENVNNVYVIYISGVSSRYLSREFFDAYGLDIIKKETFGALLLLRHIYLLKGVSQNNGSSI